MPRIADLPYTALSALAAPSATEYPLAASDGERFTYPLDLSGGELEVGKGRIALVTVPHREGPRMLLVIEFEEWSVACSLTSGQLHRLTNALGGRGTRSGVRPLSIDDEHVYLTGSPEWLVVEYRGRVAQLPAGPKRALYKSLRALAAEPPLT